MSYRAETVGAALREIAAERRNNERLRDRRRSDALARCPELNDVEAEISSLVAGAALSAFEHGSGSFEEIRENIDVLKAKKTALLRGIGLSESWLDDVYTCKTCRDTGFVGRERCSCLLTRCDAIQRGELSRLLDLRGQSFESFDLTRFSPEMDDKLGDSPRENMRTLRDFCEKYAADFAAGARNLYFYGDPGTGKTFLSSCVASAVSSRGFSVIYDTAGSLFASFENEKFGRAELGTSSPYLKCDLLILDDLGTEMSTAFTLSALYTVVNTRLMERRASIISSNLRPRALSAKYSPAIASRIEGEYLNFFFFGDDLRKKRGQP